MSSTSKRIVSLAVVMVFLFAGQVMAQTKVLYLFQLGKTTYKQVKANLPKKVIITKDKTTSPYYGGPLIYTEGKGYDIDGLEMVSFWFDKKQNLSEVKLILEDRRFDAIKKVLSSKYQLVHSKYPEASLLFKANHDYICFYLPWDKSIVVSYMTGAGYQKLMLSQHQTEEYQKLEEQRRKKALEREQAAEAAKF